MKMTFNIKQLIGLCSGPLLFTLVLLFFKPDSLPNEGIAVLASCAWIAMWWFTEVIPISVTALLPLVLFPLTGAVEINQVAAPYSNKIIFLFIGGFMMALGIEKWNLHKRIALSIIRIIGTRPDQVLLGFMMATFFMSMWISNTATTMMMVPIGMAVSAQLFAKSKKEQLFYIPEITILLGIAYSASIGGMATLIGTPTNLIFAAMISDLFGQEITFLQWLIFAFPFALALVLGCWFMLSKVIFKSAMTINAAEDQHVLQIEEMPAISYEEKAVALVFTFAALAWVSNSWLLSRIIPEINDSIIAIVGGLSLFVIPTSKDEKGRILNAKDLQKLPWGIALLFGGGLALAEGFTSSGLSVWIGDRLTLLNGAPLLLVIVIVAFVVNFLTEFTMNISTASMILPVLAQLAITLGFHPYSLMIAATLAASCAFMLPIATAPNAIVFGTEKIGMHHMVKAGIWLNLFSVLLITIWCYFLIDFIWGIDIFTVSPPFNLLMKK